MPITRVESIIYGVDDVAATTAYFDEWGLKRNEKGASGAEFALPTGQSVQVRGTADTMLPKAIEGGPTVREVIWGGDSQAELAASGIDVGARAELALEPIAADEDEPVAEAAVADEVEPAVDEAAEATANEIEGESQGASA